MGLASDLCVSRHFDAQRINELANHPEIRPSCGGDGKSFLDFTTWIENRKNHALVWDRGAAMFHWSAPHTYEVHVMVLPEGRGKEAYHMVREAVDCMFALGSDRLWARVDANRPELHHYTANAGFTKCAERDIVDLGFGPVLYDLYERRA